MKVKFTKERKTNYGLCKVGAVKTVSKKDGEAFINNGVAKAVTTTEKKTNG